MKQWVILVILCVVPVWANQNLAFHQESQNIYVGIHPAFGSYGSVGVSGVYERGVINDMFSHGGEVKLHVGGFGMAGLYRFNFHPFGVPDANVEVADVMDFYTGLSTGLWLSNRVGFMFSPMIGTKYYFTDTIGGWFEVDFYGIDLGIAIVL
ncbi:hypothetical protein [Chitinivibrio alkaliphilus]|uniref:Outer membrane protein beta-barrel domain-containing protein n=1 Tax=Chitinivibrio alkaliphilus ACht1 TaxID=1313304 RepID=U7D8U5_9BACT|nr:hypothetical protein [Chitinivibrio alkaliphilus]ERP38804.1 hypothetical protein CALK_0574 [Chitinivibrio alkaliphilus ACht1]